ncbi:hypothetical protein [Selenomonas ruminantium]|uniref:hypothetical protein n=1 Tax=Selenomonas ruminantium TaxID=971 RepID=UPI0026EF5CF9|nr:hypothetical protein [Selenomonas ruminantium]
MEVLPKLIQAYHLIYNKSRLKAVEALLGDENFFREECTFFDDGRVKSGIDRIKGDYQKLVTEIDFVKNTCQQDKDYKARLDYLYQRQYELLILMAYQSSQNPKNIDSAIKLLDGLNTPLEQGLKGLQFYFNENKEEAYKSLCSYAQNPKVFGCHYLMNKVYGLLLIEGNRFQQAIPFLLIAAKNCPEDLEIHQGLATCYAQTNNQTGVNNEYSIIKLLEE